MRCRKVERMYATITKLQIKAEEQAVEAVEGLNALLDEVGGLAGLLQSRVVRSGPRELVMVTVYESAAAAAAAADQMRPKLAQTIGARGHRRTRSMERTSGRRDGMTTPRRHPRPRAGGGSMSRVGPYVRFTAQPGRRDALAQTAAGRAASDRRRCRRRVSDDLP
jgi:heme-degrading monooxygenase HmoA